MAWPKLRKSQAADPGASATAAQPQTTGTQRLKKLARKLDELPAKDDLRIRQARELQERQMEGGIKLYALCKELVDDLNGVLKNIQIDLTPAEFNPDSMESASGVLFQINASGRIVQLAIYPLENSICTDHFRLPYVLRGAMRWFNQEYLERQEIQEQLLFYCISSNQFSWRYLDPHSRKMGMVDQEFLAEALEQLL
jgi:hypothetical protein